MCEDLSTESEANSPLIRHSLSVIYLFVFEHHLCKSHKNWKLPQCLPVGSGLINTGACTLWNIIQLLKVRKCHGLTKTSKMYC